MKANFIIGKKQIILASLVLILGVAVYLNFAFANKDFEATDKLQSNVTADKDKVIDDATGLAVKDDTASVTDVKKDTASKADTKKDETKKANATASTADTGSKTKTLGDAQLVSAKSIVDENYFVKARLSRTKARDTAIQTISTILDNEKLTEADKKQASAKAMSITDIIEAETNVENIIKSKGYEDCIVYLTATNATVVVKTKGLDQNQATQIKNIIVTEAKIKGENVSISEIK
ncbi:SpoIIIAH-like family protein [Paludicola sp. MB14-C6]|uniref:SpoIIIAH-like family protein n=1 Tax=Paludihabitans sp. MB14-C6 TaxID=3070656 RepID=UPI0027DB9C6B|nr:SpoIIIAH-like family protein [Paludicola sp. MB14-C6]WMJ23027.1 SpoIIIAH-like family protein [Paludicola sp. MB14-C6]